MTNGCEPVTVKSRVGCMEEVAVSELTLEL